MNIVIIIDGEDYKLVRYKFKSLADHLSHTTLTLRADSVTTEPFFKYFDFYQ